MWTWPEWKLKIQFDIHNSALYNTFITIYDKSKYFNQICTEGCIHIYYQFTKLSIGVIPPDLLEVNYQINHQLIALIISGFCMRVLYLQIAA